MYNRYRDRINRTLGYNIKESYSYQDIFTENDFKEVEGNLHAKNFRFCGCAWITHDYEWGEGVTVDVKCSTKHHSCLNRTRGVACPSNCSPYNKCTNFFKNDLSDVPCKIRKVGKGAALVATRMIEQDEPILLLTGMIMERSLGRNGYFPNCYPIPETNFYVNAEREGSLAYFAQTREDGNAEAVRQLFCGKIWMLLKAKKTIPTGSQILIDIKSCFFEPLVVERNKGYQPKLVPAQGSGDEIMCWDITTPSPPKTATETSRRHRGAGSRTTPVSTPPSDAQEGSPVRQAHLTIPTQTNQSECGSDHEQTTTTPQILPSDGSQPQLFFRMDVPAPAPGENTVISVTTTGASPMTITSQCTTEEVGGSRSRPQTMPGTLLKLTKTRGQLLLAQSQKRQQKKEKSKSRGARRSSGDKVPTLPNPCAQQLPQMEHTATQRTGRPTTNPNTGNNSSGRSKSRGQRGSEGTDGDKDVKTNKSPQKKKSKKGSNQNTGGDGAQPGPSSSQAPPQRDAVTKVAKVAKPRKTPPNPKTPPASPRVLLYKCTTCRYETQYQELFENHIESCTGLDGEQENGDI